MVVGACRVKRMNQSPSQLLSAASCLTPILTVQLQDVPVNPRVFEQLYASSRGACPQDAARHDVAPLEENLFLWNQLCRRLIRGPPRDPAWSRARRRRRRRRRWRCGLAGTALSSRSVCRLAACLGRRAGGGCFAACVLSVVDAAAGLCIVRSDRLGLRRATLQRAVRQLLFRNILWPRKDGADAVPVAVLSCARACYRRTLCADGE